MNDSQLELLMEISHYSHKSGRGFTFLNIVILTKPKPCIGIRATAALEIPFPSSLLPTVSSAVWSTASPTLPHCAGKLPLVKEEHLAGAVQAHANQHQHVRTC